MIKQAQIQWSNGSPVSTEFDDVYFSQISGIDETRYVFLQHNALPQRWLENPKDTHTIAETGFGTGLNLLCAWQQWQEYSQPDQTLHFVSVEKYPLEKESLKQALLQWPELTEFSEALLSVYPPLVSGWHVINLPSLKSSTGRVVLHLYLGDIHDWLNQMTAKVDAWFLDGFAPSKNPDMWGPHLYHAMARLSDQHTTMATFTAAGDVRRGLKAAGFTTHKAKGFGKKREMLYGEFTASQGPIPPTWLNDKPWFSPNIKTPASKKHAIVIGAGIAGCASAYSLATRGWKVTLIDQHKCVANGASGNAQGVLYAKLASDMNIQSEFYLAGYLYSLQLLKHVMPDKKNWDNCGVLQLAFSEKEHKRQQQFCEKFDLNDVVVAVDKQQASELAGTQLDHSGLYFKDGAWVYPTAWCEALINHPNIEFLAEHKASKLMQDEKSHWHLTVESIDSNSQVTAKELTADSVIICSAHDANKLEQLSFLPTKPIAGQVTQNPTQDMKLNMVLCGDSYVTPAHNHTLNFGATYRLKSENCDITQADHEENLAKLNKNFPSVAQQLNQHEPAKGRVSVRCTTPDYVPIVGNVCDNLGFKQRFAQLNKSKHWRFFEAAPFLKGLYLNIGHGSRGLSSAPLCAELIAAQMNNEPWPITKSQTQMLSPNRFLVNQVIKGEAATDR
jgi:tRNA 5-methylaminomethyl-2-thiouridine biosynthesis bifunctional protein